MRRVTRALQIGARMSTPDAGDRPWMVQVALDSPSIATSSNLCKKLDDELERVEVGTPLIVSCGLDAVRQVRRRTRPEVRLIADVKVSDAPHKVVPMVAGAGADGITCVAAVTDPLAMRRARDEAERRTGRQMLVQGDLLGVGPRDPQFKHFADEWILHLPSGRGGLTESLATVRAWRSRLGERLLVAGGLGPADVAPLKEAGADGVVVGSAIANSINPRRELETFKRPEGAEAALNTNAARQ